MNIIWAPEALQDRMDIWNYISSENLPAAIQLDELFSNAAARLTEHPYIGRPGKIPGTREIVPHEHYCVIYELSEDTVWILAIVHTARQWPPADTDSSSTRTP